MRRFLYGRHDPLDGLEGYDVFSRDPRLSRETVRALKNAFSTRDPGAELDLNPFSFLVYLPLETGEWVFGQGTLESRGGYLSYLLHGAVLNEEERQDLAYNPFPLAPLLVPHTGPQRSLPTLANTEARSPEGLAVHALLRGEDAAGLAATLSTQSSAYPEFKSTPHQNAAFWALVFLLVPMPVRARLSLTTSTAFLEVKTNLMGSHRSGGSLTGPARSSLPGRLLVQSATATEPIAEEKLSTLSAAITDLAPEPEDPVPINRDDVLDHVARGLGRRSLQAARHWEAIPARRRLLPMKARSLLAIWRRNASEREDWSETLALRLLTSLTQDWNALGSKHETVCPVIAEVVEALWHEGAARTVATWALNVEGNMSDCINDSTFAAILCSFEDLLPFAALLRRRLELHRDWGADFDPVFLKPVFFRLSPDLHAKVITALDERNQVSVLIGLIEERYLNQTERFSRLLESLDEEEAGVVLHGLWRLLTTGVPVGSLVTKVRQFWPGALAKFWMNHIRRDDWEAAVLGLNGESDTCFYLAELWQGRCRHILDETRLHWFISHAGNADKETPSRLAWNLF